MNFRELCLRCRRAQRVCQCADIRTFTVEPTFVILIHPVERRMKTGTGRMAHLCLSNSLLFEGVGFRDDERVNALLRDPQYYPVLLYPGKTSVPVSELAPPSDRRLLVFVIDSTWNLAKTVLNRSPNLAALPQIFFVPDRPSNFKIRRQPHPNCLSTIEAIHYLLEKWSPGREEHGYLIHAFDKMVERQLSFPKSRRHL